MTGDQFREWLDEVRELKPGVTNIEIAADIKRSDQWISNSLSRGVKAFDAMALRHYSAVLQRNCNTKG